MYIPKVAVEIQPQNHKQTHLIIKLPESSTMTSRFNRKSLDETTPSAAVTPSKPKSSRRLSPRILRPLRHIIKPPPPSVAHVIKTSTSTTSGGSAALPEINVTTGNGAAKNHGNRKENRMRFAAATFSFLKSTTTAASVVRRRRHSNHKRERD